MTGTGNKCVFLIKINGVARDINSNGLTVEKNLKGVFDVFVLHEIRCESQKEKMFFSGSMQEFAVSVWLQR